MQPPTGPLLCSLLAEAGRPGPGGAQPLPRPCGAVPAAAHIPSPFFFSPKTEGIRTRPPSLRAAGGGERPGLARSPRPPLPPAHLDHVVVEVLGVPVDQVDLLGVHVVHRLLAQLVCHHLVVGLVDVALLPDGRRVQKALRRERGESGREGEEGREEGRTQPGSGEGGGRERPGRAERGGQRGGGPAPGGAGLRAALPRL